MLININALRRFKLQGCDGGIGSVKEIYFDDHHWTVRYFVVETGVWLFSRQVLISPFSVVSMNLEVQHLVLNITKRQIKNSPSLDTDRPISRQFETASFSLPFCLIDPYMWGNPPDLARDRDEWGKMVQAEKNWDPNLHSTKGIDGHIINAVDGEIGHIMDFIIDDQSWSIRYFVVDIGAWLTGKKVLIAPKWISRISWREKKVYSKLTREKIKQSPEYAQETLNF